MEYALVTGASSGIGLEFARQLAARGYGVILAGNRREENEVAAASVARDYGVEALALHVDLTRPEAAEAVHAWCGVRKLEVAVLVSNAGMLHVGRLTKASPQTVDHIVALHCTAPAQLCRLFAADMCRRGRGRILLVSSMTAWTPFPTMSLYGATKAFLRNFGRSLWYELRDRGVSVTVLFPGAVDTPLYRLDASVRRRLRRAGVMLSARRVARQGLRAMFHGRRTCMPGVLTRVETAVCRLMPPWLLSMLFRIPAVRRLIDRLG